MERTSFEQWKPREVARLLALVETERRYYQEMVAALPVALAVLAPDRAIVSSNRAFRKLVGLSGEELGKKSIEHILPSDDLIERIRSAHVHGDAGLVSISTGERRFRIAAVPIRSWEDEMQAETLLMIEPIGADAPVIAPPPVEAPSVPEPVAPEPKIDLSSLPAVIWQADASSFGFTYVNGGVEELLGYPAAHWLVEPLFFSERMHPQDRAEVMSLYQSLAASGGETSAEYRAINASGEAVWCRETIRVPGPTGGKRLISGVTALIGERRQLEAQSLAAGRVDALRGLASRLAHDLNNPLMIVTGYTEELLGTLPADSPVRGDLAEVLAATTRMTDLTGSLLGFTRSQAKPPLMMALSGIITNLEARLNQLAGEVEIAFPHGSVWTYADPDQLEEAVRALAEFAAENTMDCSRLNITCQTSRISERIGAATLTPGVYSRLDVHTAGHGAEAPMGVFESILPAKDPRKAAAGAVARAYLNVRQWGGDILFSSGEHGSTFTVYLPYAEPPYVEPLPDEPLADEAPFTETQAVETPGEDAAEEPEPSPGTILVVEDEPGIRGLVRKILRRERYEVIEAGSAEEALAAAAEHLDPIDLLLTDVMLPGMGGRELAESLKASQPNLKVVYVSGFTDDEGVRTGEFPPGSRFLQKPFTLSALVGAVREALEP